jgi:ABC-type uncharacterized transport system permease subunit
MRLVAVGGAVQSILYIVYRISYIVYRISFMVYRILHTLGIVIMRLVAVGGADKKSDVCVCVCVCVCVYRPSLALTS